MASTTSVSNLSRGTRKTYSFEERRILNNLIVKYEGQGDEDTNSENGPPLKRKSVWSRLTAEYNDLVGPENTRSSVQLRRCWENMKANKKKREEEKLTEKSTSDNSIAQAPVGLPPNVVFQPKDSEPFAFEGLMPSVLQNQDVKRDEDTSKEIDVEEINDRESESMDDLPLDQNHLLAARLKMRAASTSSPGKVVKQRKTKCGKNNANELQKYAISEAQLRLETAALLKEEAKLKLEEAEYRKEEARMSMICANYNLQKLREECEIVEDEDEKMA